MHLTHAALRAALAAGGGAAAAARDVTSPTGDTRAHDVAAARARVGGVPTAHRIPVPTGTLHVAEWGRGVPVLLVHGFTGSHGDWLPVAAHLLAAGRRVLAVDLPGHGQSSHVPVHPLGVSRLADDVRAVLEHLDLRDVVLAGHSLGGTAVLALAIRHRRVTVARVRHLVTVAATPALRHPPELGAVAFGANPGGPLLLRGRATGRAALRLVAGGLDVPDDVLDDVRARWARCPLSTRLAYAAGAVGEDLRRRLATVPVPVVAVTGDRDRMCPPSRAHTIADGVPRGQVRVLAGAGHLVPLERPDAVAAAVLDGA